MDQGIEQPLPQKPNQGGGEGERRDAAVLLGTGAGYCGEKSRKSMGQRVYEEFEL